VYLVRADIALLIPAFALLWPPPVLAIRLLRPQNAPLPYIRNVSTASVLCLSLETLSVLLHSTSELLRTL
jgi:hypothetical protein